MKKKHDQGVPVKHHDGISDGQDPEWEYEDDTSDSGNKKKGQKRNTSESADERCPECGSRDIMKDENRGESICTRCGTVITEHAIDTGSEVRIFTNDDRDSKSRTGPPIDIHSGRHDMSTYIGTDKSGSGVSSKRKMQIFRMRRHQIREMSRGRGKNIKDALNILDRISGQMGISKDSNIRKDAEMWYSQAVERNITNSRSVEAMIAACIYLSCRMGKYPRPLDEIQKYVKDERKKIGEYYRLLIITFKLKPPIVSPHSFVSRLAAQLGLRPDEQQDAIYILEKIQENDVLVFDSKDPRGFAAAAIYLASIKNNTNNRVTQRDVAAAADITEVTVRNRYKEIRVILMNELEQQTTLINELKRELNTIPADDEDNIRVKEIIEMIESINRDIGKIQGFVER